MKPYQTFQKNSKPENLLHYPTRQSWRPGENLPKARQPNALEALARNASAHAEHLAEARDRRAA